MRYAINLPRGAIALASILLAGHGGLALAQATTKAWSDPVTSASEQMPRANASVLLDGLFLDDGRLIVVGERGHVLVSDDDGAAWRQVGTPTRSTLTGVAAHGDRVIAVGHDGVVLRSTDRGDTWQRVREEPYSIDNQASPSNGAPLLDAVFLDANRVLAVGAYNLVIESGDAGATWSAVPVNLIAGEAVDVDAGDDTAAAADQAGAPGDSEEADGGAGDEASLLFSEDELLLDDEVDPHLNAVVRLGDGALMIVGERGTIYRSRDDGASWQRVALPYGGSMFGAQALGGAKLLVFGLRGRAFESDDAGDTWRSLDVPVQATLFGASASADGSLALVGAEGAVLRRGAGDTAFAASVYVSDTGETPSSSAVLTREDGSLILIGERGVAAWRQP